MQELKKQGRRVGGCFRQCGLAECIDQQEWFMENEKSEDAMFQIKESIEAENTLDKEGSSIRATTRSNTKYLATKPEKGKQRVCCPGVEKTSELCTV